jgi:integrase
MSLKKLPSGKWEARARVGGRHLKKTFARKTDADSWLATTRHDRDRGLTVDMSSRVTVAEYFESWIGDRVVRDGTRQMYLGILRRHVQDQPLGSRPLVRVRPSEVQSWARSRAGTLSPATLANYTGILRSAFASAHLDGLLARNPAAGRLSLPKQEKPEIIPLTVAQVQAWADRADPRVRPMILAQAGLGLRISELRALRVEDVDFLRRVVYVVAQLHKLTAQRVPLKTATSRRDVRLPAMVADVLAGYIRPGQSGLVSPRTASPTGATRWPAGSTSGPRKLVACHPAPPATT